MLYYIFSHNGVLDPPWSVVPSLTLWLTHTGKVPWLNHYTILVCVSIAATPSCVIALRDQWSWQMERW